MLGVVVSVLFLTISSVHGAGLIGYWPFDNDLQDSSGSASAGAVFVGTEQYSTSVPAGVTSTHSFDFDGSSRVDLPFMDFYTTAHSTGATLSMWIKAPPQNDNRIFAEACNTGGCRSFYGVGTPSGGGGNLRRYIRSANSSFTHDITSEGTAFDDSWHHVVMTDNGGTSAIYIDGVADSFNWNYEVSSDPQPDNTTIGGWNIGGSPGSLLAGLIDDVAMWDTVLPPVSISLLAGGATPPSVSSPTTTPDLNFVWRPDKSGNWTMASNWSPGSGPPNGNNFTAIFSDAISAPTTVVVDTDVTVNSITFNHSINYGIAGLASVNLEANTETPPQLPTISVAQGSHEFQVTTNLNNDTTIDVASGSTLTFNNALDLMGNTLTKTGAGDMAIRNDLVTGSGGTVGIQQGSVSGNGTVSGNLNNDGGTILPGNSTGVNVVPEPSTLSLLLLAGWCALAVRAPQRRTANTL